MSPLYETLGQNSIRLLTLYPSPTFDHDISCQLSSHTLVGDDLIPYEALSYVWGDAADKVPATCNGHTHPITRNLDQALRWLRREDRTRTLWVDALCIDQSNLAERTAQVQIMAYIYFRSASTLIWLGEPSPSSALTFQLCNDMHAAHAQKTTIPQVVSGSRNLDAVLDFLKYPWFVRGWIIQELLLGPNPILVTGHKTMHWDVFNVMLHYLACECTDISQDAGKTSSATSALFRLAHSEGYVAVSSLNNNRQRGVAEMPDLLGLLIEFRNSSTTDPRDKVYSLLALVEGNGGLVPDYTISTRECYVRTAYSILQSTMNLRLFEALPAFSRNRDPDLPSWVPQWNSENGAETSPGQRTPSLIQASTQTGRMAAQKERHCPTPHQTIRHMQLVDADCLQLEGVVFDTVSHVAEALPFPVSPHEHLAAMGESPQHGSDFISEAMNTILDMNRVLATWRKVGIDDAEEGTYPTGTDYTTAFLATTWGPGSDMEAAGAELRKAREAHERISAAIEGIRTIVEQAPPEMQRAYSEALTAGMLMEAGSHTGVFTPRCYEKRLARTAKGYLGLLPMGAAADDYIMLLPGGDSPFVARKQGSRWKVVGAGYVHGIMDGQGWAEKEVTRIDFS